VKRLSVTSTWNLYQLLMIRESKDFSRRRKSSFKDPSYELIQQGQEISVQSTLKTPIATAQIAWSRKVNSSAQTQQGTMLPELADPIQEPDDCFDLGCKSRLR
jgi:hypothetical protein